MEGGHGDVVASAADSALSTDVASSVYASETLPLPVINNVYRCALQWGSSEFSQRAVNVIHVKKSGSNPAAIGTILDTAATASLWWFTKNTAKVSEIDITPLDGSSVTYPYIPATPAHWTGTSSSGDNTLNVAYIVKMLTASRGRSYRGRVYLPWVVETQMANGLLDATGVTNCTAAWVTFIAALASASAPLQVASYKLSTSADVIAVACEKAVATQRRRLHRTSAT
jgi:hypothetical protein